MTTSERVEFHEAMRTGRYGDACKMAGALGMFVDGDFIFGCGVFGWPSEPDRSIHRIGEQYVKPSNNSMPSGSNFRRRSGTPLKSDAMEVVGLEESIREPGTLSAVRDGCPPETGDRDIATTVLPHRPQGMDGVGITVDDAGQP